MISGEVTRGLEPIIKLILVGVDSREEEITIGIDTGFNGDLSATPETIQALGWLFNSSEETKLADGSEPLMKRYRGIVMWHGHPRIVNVLSSPGSPLLGTGLLEGNKLIIDFIRGGELTIAPRD